MSDEKQGTMYQLGNGPVPVPLEAIGRWREAGASPKLAERLAATEVRIDSVLAQILRQFGGSEPASDAIIHDLSGELQTAIPRGDDTVVELTLGAVRDLLGRLEALEKPRDVESGGLSPMAARIAAEQAAARDDIETLGKLMRANGVAWYRRGDLEIELAPADDGVGILANVPADEAVGKCLKSVAMGLCAREHGHSGLCSRDGETPSAAEPPDEQPAVEIDLAATEELLRAQDARRRGAKT